MTDIDLSRVRRLVERIHDLPDDERKAVLDRECADAPGLRAEVEALLAAAAGAPDFLDRPPELPPVAALLPTELQGGARLGEFVLVGRIASGGMGTVWEARQDSPRRTVALKTLRSFDASGEAERRFRQESEILARLAHPGIAQVFAAGVLELAAGERLPWYALELVEGAASLTAFAQRERLDLRARLTLFAELCDAVQHAHERGVVHRDLKPSNVLVDRGGTLKVIDFGVARARDAARSAVLTEPGRVIGTLQYMAPEQVGGRVDDVDARSDVYAPGVLLYELATGAPPYDLASVSLAEAARILQHAPVARPSTRAQRIPGDVDAIALVALAKEPGRRYASAAALGADVRRFLSGETILARAPSALQQLRAFARRHRAAAAAIAAVTWISVAAAGVSLLYASRARRAERLANGRFEDLRHLSRALVFDLHDAIAPLAGATQARRLLTESALTYMDVLETEAEADPGLSLEVAEGHLRLGCVLDSPTQASLGDRAAALREWQLALAAGERAVRGGAGPDAHLTLARTRLQISFADREEGRLDQALERVERAEADLARAASLGMPETRLRLPTASAQWARARLWRELGRTQEACDLLIELRQRLEPWAGGDEEVRDLLARIGLELGAQRCRQGRAAEALAELEAVLETARERRRTRPNDAEAANLLGLLRVWSGVARMDLEAFDQARADLEEGVELLRAGAAADPRDRSAAEDLAFGLEKLGGQRHRDGDAAAALEAYEESLELARACLAAAPAGRTERLNVAIGERLVADELAALDRAEEATAALERALQILRDLESAGAGDRTAASTADSGDVPAEAPAKAPEEGSEEATGSDREVERQLGAVLARLASRASERGDFERSFEMFQAAADYLARTAASDPSDASAQRMPMALRSQWGVALKSAAERAGGARRADYYRRSIEAFDAALELEPRLRRAGFLWPSDDEAIELMRADAESCRAALRSLQPDSDTPP